MAPAKPYVSSAKTGENRGAHLRKDYVPGSVVKKAAYVPTGQPRGRKRGATPYVPKPYVPKKPKKGENRGAHLRKKAVE